MKKIMIGLMSIIIITVLILYGFRESETTKAVKVKESFYKSGKEDSSYVELTKINDNIWIHTTYENYNGNRTSSNGLLLVSKESLLLVDTPWNNEQTKELMKLTNEVFQKDITVAIITHAHDDRIGGIDTLLENKIDVRSTSMTVREAEKLGYQQPQPTLDIHPTFTLDDIEIETYFPGEGHTVDNITVWFPNFKVLFGGCIIKSLESTNKGNIADANVEQWPVSVKNVQDKYKDAEIVIPGHGNWGNSELIQHTIDIISKD